MFKLHILLLSGKRKSSTGSVSSYDSSPPSKSEAFYRPSSDYMLRKISNSSIDSYSTCLSNSSTGSSIGDRASYLPPVEPFDSTSCYLPSAEPYPEELDHYIVIEDPAEIFLRSNQDLSYKHNYTMSSYSSNIPSYTSNLTMPTYDWSTTGNDYRDTVCHSIESERDYSSINSTVSDYEYLLPTCSLSDSIPVAQEIEVTSTSPPASPQPAKFETMKTLDMIIDDMMNTPVPVGDEKGTQTDCEGLPSISSIINGWKL